MAGKVYVKREVGNESLNNRFRHVEDPLQPNN